MTVGLAMIGAAMFAVVPPPVEVLFSPETSPGELIEMVIDSAETSLDIALYKVDRKKIASRLYHAAARGVKIRVLLDRDENKHSKRARKLTHHGIAVRLWGKGRENLHEKYLLVDGRLVVTGSFNFTHGGLKENREMTVIIRDPDGVDGCRREFERLWREGRVLR